MRDAATLAMVTAEMPSHTVGRGALDTGLPITDAQVASGRAASKGKARSSLGGGGISVKGVVASGAAVVTISDLLLTSAGTTLQHGMTQGTRLSPRDCAMLNARRTANAPRVLVPV